MRIVSFAFPVLLIACGGKAAGPTAPTGGSGAAPAVVTLKDLQNGDRACYVVVESADGEQSIEGDFELCAGGAHDASALIGKSITYTTERAKVQAASCQGDPECSDSDEVDLVITIAPAP